jgi:hypothetical protein
MNSNIYYFVLKTLISRLAAHLEACIRLVHSNALNRKIRQPHKSSELRWVVIDNRAPLSNKIKLNLLFCDPQKVPWKSVQRNSNRAPFVDKGGVAGQNEKASLRVIYSIVHAPHLCPNGGIGRRARFRTWFSQGSGGSSPLSGTKFN